MTMCGRLRNKIFVYLQPLKITKCVKFTVIPANALRSRLYPNQSLLKGLRKQTLGKFYCKEYENYS